MHNLTFDEHVRYAFGSCPGGADCTCCHEGCDCGCRDACPVFREVVRGRLRVDAPIAKQEEKP